MHGVLGPTRTCLAIAALLLSFVTGAACAGGRPRARLRRADARAGPDPALRARPADRCRGALVQGVRRGAGARGAGLRPRRQPALLRRVRPARAPPDAGQAALHPRQPGPARSRRPRDPQGRTRLHRRHGPYQGRRRSIIAVEPDGSGMRTIVPPEAGYMPNDLVFDARGGFYFTDFRGASTDPKGGVYYVSPDFGTITPVLPRLAMANGVALSPDGKELWATEFSRNLLHRVELADATTATPIGTAVPYHFTGPAPDSMRADADGNLYVAMYGQGRVLVVQQERHPHRPGAAAGPGRGPQPAVHQHGHQAGHRRPLHRDERRRRWTRCDHLPRQGVRQGSAALLAPVTPRPPGNIRSTQNGARYPDGQPLRS